MDIAEWLSNLGLARYASTFAEHEITPEALPYLSDTDLMELGLPMGPRKLVLAAIAELGKRGQTPRGGPVTRPEAERRQLTVMFVDLIGSTALSGQLDPEEMGEVIRRYQNAVAEKITRLEGHVAKFMGDGVLAYFGWPRAHEDAAERSVRAGLAIAAAVAKLPTPTKDPLAARTGIATGLVMVGDLIGEGAAQEEAVVGETPNLAARLQSLAGPGSVVVAESTRRLLGERFGLVDLGSHNLKGFSRSIQAWLVVGEGRAESRFEARHGMRLTPLFGRDQELVLLLDRWERAKNGEGQVVLLSGEPGIGKSRITIALRERIRGEESVLLLYQGSPYHTHTALFPIMDQLHRAAGFAPEDMAEQRLIKLEALLGQAVPDPKSAIPLIAEHLSIPTGDNYPTPEFAPEQKKAKTFQLLLAQLESLAAQRPVLMIAEDVHWFDPTSLELFDVVVSRLQKLSVLLIVTFRPEFAPCWTDRGYVTLLTLNRLAQNQGSELINHLSGGRRLPAEVEAQILTKTEGVPLFVEELTKAVLESGLLREASQRYELIGSLPSLAIPSTLQDSLLARLDRLPPIKEVAQIGAVIGREFSYELLAAITEMDERKLRTALEELVRAELAFCRGAGSSAIYTFKHALVQDAAYQSLLMRRRQQLHRRILMVLRERFPGRAKAEPEVLAHHATEAGLLDQAVSYWHEAGLRDSYQSASAEAIAHLSRALDLLARLPESPGRHQREIDLQAALGVPLAAVKGRSADETMAAYVRAHELCNLQGGETSQFFTALRGLWTCYRARGQMRMACDLADRLISIARRSGETPLLLEAHHAQWTTQFCLGAWRALCEHTRQGLALYRPEHFSDAFVYGGHDAAVCGTAKEGVSLWMLGYPDKALARVEQSIVLARRLSHAPSILHALFYATVVHHFRGEATAARDTAEAALQIARDQLPSWTPYAELQMSLISALEEKPQARDRIVTIQEALAIGGHSDVEGKGFLVCLFADVCGLAGEAEIGMNALEPAIAEVTATGARLWESELHRIAANLRLSSPVADPERGEIHYRRAIEVAREQQSPSLDLRASTSLARLWADRGERQKAYNLLAPIYATFTEGFGTHDLIEARALINELG